MKNLQNLSKEELLLISGGGFFKRVGRAVKKLYCGCGTYTNMNKDGSSTTTGSW